MTKNEILKKIGIIIIELREQYDLTQLNRDDINDIELELFAANSHFLTDHIEILRKLNKQDVKPLRQQPAPEPAYADNTVKTVIPEMEEPVLNLPEDVYDAASAEPYAQANQTADEEPAPEPIIRHELFLDEKEMAAAEEEELNQEQEIIEEETEYHTEQTEPTYEPEPEPLAQAEPDVIIPEPEIAEPPSTTQVAEVVHTQIIIEDPAAEIPLVTINQMISAQMSNTPRFGDTDLQPIKDLKSAITLNDKLLFVRDLFNGYSMAYSEAIEILNRFHKFEEADNFLKLNYYSKNNWEAKQATTDKFYQLLKRRFA